MMVRDDSGSRRWIAAHRIAYMLSVGAIPEGYEIDHVCRNSLCCNPAHLEPVTPDENQARCAGGNHALHKAGVCAKGHKLVGDNLFVWNVRGRKNGMRVCRICYLKNAANYRARKRARLAAEQPAA